MEITSKDTQENGYVKSVVTLKKEEFNLSEKLMYQMGDGELDDDNMVVHQIDLEEFIKELRKSRLCRYANDQDIIDKLVGDKFI